MIKKILFPHSSSSLGGSKNSSFLLCEDLINLGYTPIQLFPYPGDAVEKSKSHNLKTILYRGKISKNKLENTQGIVRKVLGSFYALNEIIRARKVIQKLKPDLVHINDDVSMLTWGFAAKSLKVPVIWHIRQEIGNSFLDVIRDKISSHNLYVAKKIKSRTKNINSKTPKSILYNGVDVDLFYPTRDTINIPLKICFIGNLVQRKRPEWVAQAVADLINQGLDVSVNFVGKDYSGGKYLESLKKISQSCTNPEKFHFLGFRTDIPEILRNSDILVLPSVMYGEAFPRVILEAMASGACVISTNVAGVPEIITSGENGYLIDHDRYDELVSTLSDLIASPQKIEKIKINSRKTIMEKFQKNITYNQIKEIYEGILY